MSLRFSERVSELLREYQFVSSSPHFTHAARIRFDDIPLMDLLLHANTCYVVFFWVLRGLMRDQQKDAVAYASTAMMSSAPVSSGNGVEESERGSTQHGPSNNTSCPRNVIYARMRERDRLLAQLQQKQDDFTKILGYAVLGPSLYACLCFYLHPDFDISSIRRDVQAILSHCQSPYCMESTEEAEEEEDDSLSNERVACFHLSSHSSSSSSAEEESDEEEKSQIRKRRRESGDSLRTAALLNSRHRRWLRARASVASAPPPVSTVATFLLAIVSALLDSQDHFHRQQQHSKDFKANAVYIPWLLPALGVEGMGEDRNKYEILTQGASKLRDLLSQVRLMKPPVALRSCVGGVTRDRGRKGEEPDDAAGLVLNVSVIDDDSSFVGATNGQDRRQPQQAKTHKRPRAALRDPFAFLHTHNKGDAIVRSRVVPSVPAEQQPLQQMNGTTSQAIPRRRLSPPPLTDIVHRLPLDAQRAILEFLPPRYVMTASCVCRTWRALTRETPQLHFCCVASHAVTRAYVHYFTEDWGEKCVQLPTLTTVHRLYRSGGVRRLAAAVQATWNSIVHDEHVLQAVLRRSWQEQPAVCRRRAVLREQEEERAWALGQPQQRQPIIQTATATTRQPAVSSSLSSSFVSHPRLPIVAFVLHVLEEYEPGTGSYESLLALLEALHCELRYAVFGGGCDGGTSSRLQAETLRQQYLLFSLLASNSRGDSDNASGVAPSHAVPSSREDDVLLLLWRHWPSVRHVYLQHLVMRKEAKGQGPLI